MVPRQELKQDPKKAASRQERKPKLQIVKLEERIAPGLSSTNHNETLVRESAKPKVQQNAQEKRKSKFAIVKLEGRITPGINLGNHNETLVHDRSAKAW